MTDVLMPKATAVWLVDNTGLTFDQIAEFCVLHPLEVKGIADGDVAVGVRGQDPIANGQLTREEIERAEANPDYRMRARAPKYSDMATKPGKRKGSRYTPLSRRNERPNAIAWMVRNHPEVPDSQIVKLLGTTKTTIQAVRERTHWNAPNIKPEDPVALGLCAQLELDAVVRKAADKKRAAAEAAGLPPEGPTLKPAPAPIVEDEPEEIRPRRGVVDADAVFAKLGGAGKSKRAEDDAG